LVRARTRPRRLGNAAADIATFSVRAAAVGENAAVGATTSAAHLANARDTRKSIWTEMARITQKLRSGQIRVKTSNKQRNRKKHDLSHR
jgi:uncharacterized protein involved in propanediol utilization